MRKKKSVLGVVLTNIGGLLLFFVVLALANIFLSGISNEVFRNALDFINKNLGLIILFSIFFFFAELCYIFILPFNLPYPIFNAMAGFLLVIFIFRIFSMIEKVSDVNLFPLINFKFIVATFVFFIVLIVGYVRIFTPKRKVVREKKTKEKKKKSKDKTEWQDVSEEFRLMLLDIITRIRSSFKKKK